MIYFAICINGSKVKALNVVYNLNVCTALKGIFTNDNFVNSASLLYIENTSSNVQEMSFQTVMNGNVSPCDVFCVQVKYEFKICLWLGMYPRIYETLFSRQACRLIQKVLILFKTVHRYINVNSSSLQKLLALRTCKPVYYALL